SLIELIARHCLELGLRVVNVIDIHGFKPEVVEAASELVFQITRRHAVAAAYDIFRLSNTLGDHIILNPRSRIPRWFIIKREEPAFRRYDYLVARIVPAIE